MAKPKPAPIDLQQVRPEPPFLLCGTQHVGTVVTIRCPEAGADGSLTEESRKRLRANAPDMLGGVQFDVFYFGNALCLETARVILEARPSLIPVRGFPHDRLGMTGTGIDIALQDEFNALAVKLGERPPRTWMKEWSIARRVSCNMRDWVGMAFNDYRATPSPPSIIFAVGEWPMIGLGATNADRLEYVEEGEGLVLYVLRDPITSDISILACHLRPAKK